MVLTIARERRNFVAALDVLYVAAAQSADGDVAELAGLAAHLAPYALAHEKEAPAWLAKVKNDKEFVVHLQQDLRAWAAGPEPTPPREVTLGFKETVWERVKKGSSHLSHEVGAFLGKPAWNAVRELVVPTVPRFLGDAFVYLSEQRGGTPAPGPIRARVIEALHEGSSKRTSSDPLIVVGHSLGGAIAYDVLSSFCPDIQVDVLCTVGSQVGLLEEIKVFGVSDRAVTAAVARKATRPPRIDHWINVFDYNDVLSYKLEPVFAGVTDYDYPTGELLHAHGAYFGQPSFFQRLGTRVQEVLGP